MAEGARFELAAHEVGAGFQDRWIKPLSHPSERDFNYLWLAAAFSVAISVAISEVPRRWHVVFLEVDIALVHLN